MKNITHNSYHFLFDDGDIQPGRTIENGALEIDKDKFITENGGLDQFLDGAFRKSGDGKKHSTFLNSDMIRQLERSRIQLIRELLATEDNDGKIEATPETPVVECSGADKTDFQTIGVDTPDGPGKTMPAMLNSGAVIAEIFEVREFIARGGSSDVYKGVNRKHGNSVAIKILRADGQRLPSLRCRLVREVEALAKIRHPSVIHIHDVKELADTLCLITDYVPGENLHDYIVRNGKLDAEEAIVLMTQLLEAMVEVHDRGIVHRDLKPSNIIIDNQDRPVVIDFGLAKFTENVLHTHSRLTSDRDFIGTLGYMSPEQCESPTKVTQATDIYSLGVVFYQMVTGHQPIPGRTITEFVDNIRKFDPPAAHIVDPAVPADLGEIIRHMMAKKPEDRYKNCADALTAFRDISNISQSFDDDRVDEHYAGINGLLSRFLKPASHPMDRCETGEYRRSIIQRLGNIKAEPPPKALTGTADSNQLNQRRSLIVVGGCIALGVLMVWLFAVRSDDAQSESLRSASSQSQVISVGEGAMADRPDAWSSSPRIFTVIPFPSTSSGNYFTDQIASYLMKSDYDLVERERVETIINELKLSQSEFVSREDAVRVGLLSGAHIIITGNLNSYQGDGQVIVRAFSVETSEILGITPIVPEDTGSAVESLMRQLTENLEFRSRVHSIDFDAKTVKLGHGKVHGARAGMKLRVLDDDESTIGVVTIESADRQSATAAILSGDSKIRPGMRVQEIKESEE